MKCRAWSVWAVAVLAAGCIEQRNLNDDGGAGGSGGVGGTVVADGGTGGVGPPPTYTCPELDNRACMQRADCVWTELRCIEPPPACGTHLAPNACAEADCHWWTGGCHEGEDPSRCDQPDPGSCEAAGCEWADDRGCAVAGSGPLPCGRLGPDACARDRRCHLVERNVCPEEQKDAAGPDGDEEGGGGGGGGAGSSGAEERPRDPCDVEQVCQDVEGACIELDARGCDGRDDCAWVDAEEGAGEPQCDCADESDGSDGSGDHNAPCDCAGFPAPAAGCQPREQVDCAPLDLVPCREAPACAQLVIDHCGGAGDADRAPCREGDEECGGGGAPGNCEEIVCAPGAEVCPQLEREACDTTTDCTSLVDDEGNDLGCWFNDECRGLEVGQCQAHPNCGWTDGGGDGCDCGGYSEEEDDGDGNQADRDCICDVPDATCEHL